MISYAEAAQLDRSCGERVGDFLRGASDELRYSEPENSFIDADQLPACRTLLLSHRAPHTLLQ
jgi:hypothetical protein